MTEQNVPYSVYRLSDGMIAQSGSSSPSSLADKHWPEWPLDEQAVHPEELDDSVWYLPNGIPTERPILTAADATIPTDGADHVIAAELPEGTTVFMDGVSQGETSGALEVSAHEPGTFTLRLVPPFPWREATIAVTAT